MIANFGQVILRDGNPVCHICGKDFKRLLTHVRQTHNVSAREYKEHFGLNVSVGIVSQESKKKSQRAVENNFDKVVTKNLIKKGRKTRFQNGDGRKIERKLSHQEFLRLQEWAKINISEKEREEIGRKLGKSGLGNKKRWGN